MSIVSYLRAMIQLGPRYVAVTDGARGAFIASREEIIFSPALETKVVGTAGAGDAFGATLTAYLALGYRMDAAVSAATANSASVVGHVDTQTGLLRRHELDQRVPAGQRAIRRWPAAWGSEATRRGHR